MPISYTQMVQNNTQTCMLQGRRKEGRGRKNNKANVKNRGIKKKDMQISFLFCFV